MLIYELAARFRKELLLSGSALYETVMALAERVNRKVHILRLHAQATHHLQAIRTVHCQVGRQVAQHIGTVPDSASALPRPSMAAMDSVIGTAAARVRQLRDHLVRIEGRIRELKSEVAHEELLAIQRDLSLREAGLERVLVDQGAPILGHRLGDLAMPATTRIAAAFRGPFLLPLSDDLLLRPGDVVLVAGLRADLDQLLPRFQRQRASRTAS